MTSNIQICFKQCAKEPDGTHKFVPLIIQVCHLSLAVALVAQPLQQLLQSSGLLMKVGQWVYTVLHSVLPEEVGRDFKFNSRTQYIIVQVLLTQQVDLGCGGVYCSLWKVHVGTLM